MRKKYEAGSKQLAYYLGELGTYYFDQERMTEAEKLLQEATHIYQRNPFECNSASYYICLGRIYNNQNRLIEAETIITQAAEIRLKISPTDDKILSEIYVILGEVFTKQSKFEKAQTILLKALSILKTIQIDENADYIYWCLADICCKQGKWPECERY